MNKSTIRNYLPYLIVAFGMVYGIWPLDVIPDIPVIGWVDDIRVLGTTFLISLILFLRKKQSMKQNDTQLH